MPVAPRGAPARTTRGFLYESEARAAVDFMLPKEY